MVTYHDPTNAERIIGVELAASRSTGSLRVSGKADREAQSAAVYGGQGYIAKS